MLLRYFYFIICSLLLQIVHAGFIRGHDLPKLNYSVVALEPFVIFVAIDVEKKLMKFLINSKVISPQNINTTDAIITDVDYATNRYTTLNVEIDFMGKTFVRENLRFCDILAVKNTSLYEDTYRFDGLSSATISSQPRPTGAATALPNPDTPGHKHYSSNIMANSTSSLISNIPTGTSKYAVKMVPLENSLARTSFANSNSSIEALFSNKTGNLISGPLYQNDSIALYYQADVSENYQNCGSYSVRFTVVSNNEDSDIIGGAVAYVTSSVKPKSLERLLFYGVLSICVCSFVMNFMIIISSPDQESQNPFLIEASAICNEGLLRQLEAHPLALTSYLQFALFMTGLNVQYPGFFQYLMTRINWCALLSINVFHKWASLPPSQQDNVFLTYYSGLRSLAQYSSNGFNHYSWPNFVTCLLIWTAAGMASYQSFILLKALVSRNHSRSFLGKFFGYRSGDNEMSTENDFAHSGFRYSLSTNMWALLGQILREFLTTFGFPFLVLTIYMLFTASRYNGFHGDPFELSEASAFNGTIPYDALSPTMKGYYIHPMTGREAQISSRDEGPTIPALSVAFGIASLCAWFGSALYFLYSYISPISLKGHRKQKVAKLYTSVKATVTWGYLYNAYKPSKVSYVAVDIFACILSSIVIAALQDYPTAQVALMVVLESIRLILLFTIRPYFLDMSWHSLPVLMSMSRLIVTILNIPYLRELNVSEASRTYVAYAQMFIHSLVAISYALHLIYCLAITILAFIRVHKKTQTDLRHSNEHANDNEVSSLQEFEFKQVSMQQAHLFKKDSDDVQSSAGSSLDDGEVDYYRSKSERILRNMEFSESTADTKASSAGSIDEDSILDFQQTENRIRETDYTTREADRIFQKYFSTNEMDPEMKELWASRDWGTNIKHLSAKVESTSTERGFFANLWQDARAPRKKGFEVVRRRPIVVKPPAASDVEREENDLE
ncbi:hypothetical protein JCM33374_g2735 [Metschnikowia sp. JCM 33374]|nr:hypothetical protein JCM33374_g2735 [Metschnikowia sp. JCM 33374]